MASCDLLKRKRGVFGQLRNLASYLAPVRAVLNDDMSQERSAPPPQTVHMAPGARVVINGALVSTREACTLEIGAGAFVLEGSAPRNAHDAPRNPCDELYFSLLDCCADEERFINERFRIFGLLGEVLAQQGSHASQREAARCAAALMAGDAREAMQCAARIASSGMDLARTRTKVPGAPEDRRKTARAPD